jgi:toxin ParE1/3/4
MEITLTADQQAFIKLALADGRLRSEEEAVAEALALWEERERNRIAFLATLTDARASVARGEGRSIRLMRLRIAPQAEEDLDSIWFYVATESASVEVADRLVDSLTSRFLLLSRHPYVGRSREHEFGPGMRSLAVSEYVIVYTIEQDSIQVLRMVHGRRDLESIFNL